jgi:hypothetical protein
MGHEISWDNNDKTVVLQQYVDEAKKGDLFSLAKKSAAMLNTVPYVVHLIIDERISKLTLSGSDMRYLEKFTPPNQGAVIMVIQPNEVTYKTMVNRIGKTVAPKSFDLPYFVSTIEEAREILKETFEVNYP